MDVTVIVDSLEQRQYSGVANWYVDHEGRSLHLEGIDGNPVASFYTWLAVERAEEENKPNEAAEVPKQQISIPTEPYDDGHRGW